MQQTAEQCGEINDFDTAKEHLKNCIRKLLERGGRYQLILIVLLSFNSVIVGINHTITAFHIYMPHFYCSDDPEPNGKNCYRDANGTICPSGFIFDKQDDYSVAVQFEMICHRAMLAPLINTLYFVGVSIGSLVCSSQADVYGRRKMVLLCLYGQALTSWLQIFSSSYLAFVCFRALQGFFIQGLQTCSYTLAMEFCPTRYRTKVATYWESNWAIGLGLLGALAYFIRDWRILTLAVSTPAVLSLTYTWMFQESLTWLEVKGRHKDIMVLLRTISLFNKDGEALEEYKSMLPLIKNETICYGKTAAQEVENNTSVKLIPTLKHRILRKHLLSMICIWFSVTLSYYGILYFLPNLAGQRHLNFELGALIELIAYILAYFTLSTLGRRIPMVFYQFCNGCLLLLTAALITYSAQNANQGWIIAITLIAKGLAVSSFCGMFIYCSELLPTITRGLGLGICGCAARIGSLLAPQLMSLISILPTFVPLTIMSIMLIASGFLTIFLPETMSLILPNTIQEAELIWGDVP